MAGGRFAHVEQSLGFASARPVRPGVATHHASHSNQGKRAHLLERVPTKSTQPLLTSPQPKSDVSDLGHFKVPNSGKPEFGWGEVTPRTSPNEFKSVECA